MDSQKRDDFKRLILLREGLTFQDQLEIARALIPLLEPKASAIDLKSLLRRIEEYKSHRNAMAHGTDISDEAPGNNLRIETVTRAGKQKSIEITPKTHRKMIRDTEILLDQLLAARKAFQSG